MYEVEDREWRKSEESIVMKQYPNWKHYKSFSNPAQDKNV